MKDLFIEGKLSKFPGSGGIDNQTGYEFATEPRPYQFECWDQGKDRKFHAIFMQYGTGKSKVLIDTAAYLYEKGKINGVIIVAPKGVYRNFITDPDGEIPKHLPARIPRTIGYYDAKGDKKSRAGLERLLNDPKGLAWLLINVESLATESGIECLNAFIEKLDGRILMGIDESTTIKNHSAKRTKVAINIGKKVAYRRILTGDPYVDSPLDVFGQCLFLDPTILGSSWVNFRAQFADLAPIPGQESRPWMKRVVGFKNLEQLKARVAPHAYFASKDLLGLPPKVYLPARHADMTSKQRQAYNDMKMFSLAEIGRQLSLNFDMVEGDSISFDDLQKALPVKSEEGAALPTAVAEIVLTKLLRLQQIACGFVKTDDGKETDLCDGHNPRVREVMEAIEEMGGAAKVIIWAPFTRSIHEIADALTAQYGHQSVVTYHGETSGDDRESAKQAFQIHDGPVRFFVGNQSTAGRGITLTEATGVIYYADTFYNEHRANSEDRAHRYGLDHSVTYQNIRVAPVDDKITEALTSKISVSKSLRQSLKDGSWKGLFE